MPDSRTIVVVAAGPVEPAARAWLPEGACVVAADSGVDAARALGLAVDVAVGDFDSVTGAGLAAVEGAGARLQRHPAAKDATDLELALETALELGAARIFVVGAAGGRLDHLLSTLLLFGHRRWEAVELDALLGSARAHVIRSDRSLEGEPGELVSLLPLHGRAEGVVTKGLRYPLRGETLEPGSSRGVSNVFAEARAHVRVGRGTLLAIRPGEREETT